MTDRRQNSRKSNFATEPEIFGVDRYKRLLSTIFIDGKDINLVMIEMGLAEVYRGPESGNPYKV